MDKTSRFSTQQRDYVKQLQQQAVTQELANKQQAATLKNTTKDTQILFQELDSAKKRIMTLEDKVKKLEDDVKILKDNVKVLKEDMISVKSIITSMQADITSLQGSISQLQTNANSTTKT